MISNSIEIDSADEILMKFNSKWDLLMPVCKKWKYFANKLIKSNYNDYSKLRDELDDIILTYDINRTWNQLVENIKWYNNLK